MDTLTKQLSDAITLIKSKFEGKKDKGGHPYIEHLFAVANSIKEIIDDLTLNEISEEVITFFKKAQIVALLHDILEDTDTTTVELDDLGFGPDIVEAVSAITRKHSEHLYFDYIDRVKKNDLAKCVKIFDLENNMDIRRLKELGEKDLKRISKYWHCWKYLRGQITSMDCKLAIHPDLK